MSMDSVEAAVESTLPAEEASEGKTNAPAAAGGDIRSEMVEFLKEASGEGEERPEEPAKASAPTDEGDEPEVEAKADESEEDEEVEAKSGDEPEKPKKPSGWQKSKAKIKAAEERAEKSEARIHELEDRDAKWEHVSSTFQSRLEESEARNAQLEERLRELGAGPDPRDAQLATLERQVREQAADVERREREFEAKQKRESEQDNRRRIDGIRAQVAKVAGEHGIDAALLAARAASAANTAKYLRQPPPSLADVAAEIVALDRHRAGTTTQRQAEVSQSAPRTVRGAAPSPVSPSFEANSAGGIALLKSQGLL